MLYNTNSLESGEVVRCTPIQRISSGEIGGSGVEIAHPLFNFVRAGGGPGIVRAMLQLSCEALDSSAHPLLWAKRVASFAVDDPPDPYLRMRYIPDFRCGALLLPNHFQLMVTRWQDMQ